MKEKICEEKGKGNTEGRFVNDSVTLSSRSLTTAKTFFRARFR